MDANSFDTFDYRTLDTKLLLFQSGYLTVKSVKKGKLGIPPLYTLGIPNNEVRNSLLEYFLSSYTSYPLTDTSIMRDCMCQQLLKSDGTAFEKSAKKLFTKIPYQLHIPLEAYYHSLLLLWLTLLGFDIQGEVSTDKGRIDAVLILENNVIVAEVKFAADGNSSLLVRDAFKQIYDNKYYERYRDDDRKISLLGIGFTGKTH